MNKVVVITGASSGIGKSMKLFNRKRTYGIFTGTGKDQRKYPKSQFTLIKSDVKRISRIDDLINHVKIKEGRIDVLINNAGIGYTGPIEESKIDDIESLFSTNFLDNRNIKKTLPVMRENNGGLIINITSIAGYIGLPFRGIFCASKSALEILTESLRTEIKDHGIKVVNVAPGDVKTDVVSRRIDSFNDRNSIYFKKYYKTWKGMNEDVEEGGIDL